jgi:hypothetical protein
MCRRAFSAIQVGPENAPNGSIHCIIPVTPSASAAMRSVARRQAVASLSARYTRTWRHIPEATAMHAWITEASIPGVSGPA